MEETLGLWTAAQFGKAVEHRAEEVSEDFTGKADEIDGRKEGRKELRMQATFFCGGRS